MNSEVPKYPDIVVKLIGQNGNSFNLLALVDEALRKAKVPKTERDLFLEEAMSGDRNNLLVTCMKWVDVS